jgi:hypothetical protein
MVPPTGGRSIGGVRPGRALAVACIAGAAVVGVWLVHRSISGGDTWLHVHVTAYDARTGKRVWMSQTGLVQGGYGWVEPDGIHVFGARHGSGCSEQPELVVLSPVNGRQTAVHGRTWRQARTVGTPQVDGYRYTMTSGPRDTVTALDSAGHVRWQHTGYFDWLWAMPGGVGITSGGMFTAYSVTGRPRWQGPKAESASWFGRAMYLVSNFTLERVDPGTGHVSWQVPLPRTTHEWEAVAADGIVAVSNASRMLAFHDDGTPAWRRSAGGDLIAASGGASTRSATDRARGPVLLPATEPAVAQPAARSTSAAIRASTSGVSSSIANAVGHMLPSSSAARSLNPNVS